MIPVSDTIVAIATAAGRSGIGVVRVSGPGVCEWQHPLFGRLLPPRQALLCTLRDEHGEAIDQVVALYFAAPASYTGEDVLELHGHGNPVILQAIVQRCVQLGARLARPGEFTERAFLNDKIDLAQAESVADLIDAGSIEAARCAMRSLEGEFSRLIGQLAQELLEVRIQVESMLDFPEEVPEYLHALRIVERLQSLLQRLRQIEQAGRQGSLLREGIQVVLIGQPNVGKSSLLNRLAGNERAIVTDIAGTTRDTLRETIVLHGITLHIIDTAGLRDTSDPIEKIGIERTWQAIGHATLALLLVDARQGITAADQAIIDRLPPGLPQLLVHNKCDLPGADAMASTAGVSVSARTGHGLDVLQQRLFELAGWRGNTEGIYMARERQLQALQATQHHVTQALDQLAIAEWVAEELRLAHIALSAITGAVSADDLLGEIFSRFCIGK